MPMDRTVSVSSQFSDKCHSYRPIRAMACLASCILMTYLPITKQYCILTHYRYKAVENIVRKGEIACNKQFVLFSQCFLAYMALTLHLKCTLKCRLQFVSI